MVRSLRIAAATTAFLFVNAPAHAAPAYLNDQNMTVALGESMAAEPFANQTTAVSLANVIDAPTAASPEDHISPTTHVWVSGGPLELDFDLLVEYDLTTLHIWNYHTENFDVDDIDFTFFDSSMALVGTLLDVEPALGGNGGNPIFAENIPLSFPSKVRYVNAVLTGSNAEVDFNNLGFTGEISNPNCGDGTIDQPGEECDDGNSSADDGCDASCRIESLCGPQPQPAESCHLVTAPGKGQLQIKDPAGQPQKRQVKWKWSKGEATTFDEFCSAAAGGGSSTGNYHFCIYDDSAKPQPLAEIVVRPGGTCDGKDCWKIKAGKKCQFKDKAAQPRGVSTLKLISGGDGKAKMLLKGKGLEVPDPDLAPNGLDTDVTVQMLVDDGTDECWQSTFTTPKRNDAEQFKAKGP
ncbi:MAG TPA: myxococcus cysteine-rich repeat containing protein [Candidatus Binatia bacterium]|nr:myxococcus cysteine-rich repeat containing protein [Candidatus Binatia bacterium]